MTRVGVIDYGMGNLLSVCRALEHCGAEATLVSRPEQIEGIDRLVLPGVGAFKDGMRGLRAGSFVEPIVAFAATGRPFLGICLGMQMMFDVSEEFGEHEGLHLIPGRVAAISDTGADGTPHKIPHIGWNALAAGPSSRDWSTTPLAGIDPGTYTYFVHSYAVVPEHDEHRLAECDYNGVKISAVTGRDNLFGAQFHPEKSGRVGLQIVRNFLAM